MPSLVLNQNESQVARPSIHHQFKSNLFFTESLPPDYALLSKDLESNIASNDSFVVISNISNIQTDSTASKWFLFKLASLNDRLLTNSNTDISHLQTLLPPHSCLVSSLSTHTIASLSNNVFIRPINPVVLENVIVLCPHHQYNPQNDNFSLFYSTQSSSILRQGEFCQSLGGIIKLCDPVDQGIVSPTKTKITIVKDTTIPPSNQGLLNNTTDKQQSVENNDDDEIAKYLDFVNDSTALSKSLELNDSQFSKPIKVIPLKHQIPNTSIVPFPHFKDDPESRAFAKVDLLAELGCFSGDVMILKSKNGDTTRHVTLYSYPEPNTVPSKVIYISPVLLHNLGSPTEVLISKSHPIIKTESKSESSSTADECSYAKHIKTAKEVTISRLASPVTTDRTLQQAFLSGLRVYFESCHRIVRNGDVITIPIDTILAKTLFSTNSSNSNNPNSNGQDDADEGPIPQGKPNAVAWFKITNVDYDSENSNGDDVIINPSQTRMIQSGIVTGNTISTKLPWKQYLSLPLYPDFDGFLQTNNKLFTYASKFQQYLAASISPLGASLQTTILLSSTKRGAGKTSLVHGIAESMGIHVFEIDGYNSTSDNDAKTFGILKARVERAFQDINPCIVLIKHLDAIAKKSEQDGKDGAGISSNIIQLIDSLFGDNNDENSQNKKNFILVATVADADKLSESVRSKFKFELELGVPSEPERLQIFNFISSKILPTEVTFLNFGNIKLPITYSLRNDVSLSTLALQSAGLTPPDLKSIIQTSKQKALKRLTKTVISNKRIYNDNSETTLEGKPPTLYDLILSSGGVIKITPDDMEQAISEARQKYSDSIGAPRIPNVSWDDVGGLENVKKEILDTIEMPLKYPELFSGGMKKRSGILFYGPPGTGKTLLAKAIATTFSLNFFSVKGPELLNMYIGESEANVRRVFQKARDAKPCVVFFDELDSVAPKRGNQGDSGGVMDRIVSQLLAELDGMSGGGGEGVFVVGATNRPDLLDEALLRPGRFDKMVYLGVSDTHEKQQTILEALTRKFKLSSDISLQQIAQKCPFTYTGADFYAMCSDAMLNAMTRTANEVDEKFKKFNETERIPNNLKPVSIRWWFENVAKEEDIDVVVTEKDFDKSLRELIPSVSAEELRHYLRVRENFQSGKKKAQSSSGNNNEDGSNNNQLGVQLDSNNNSARIEDLIQSAIKASLEENNNTVNNVDSPNDPSSRSSESTLLNSSSSENQPTTNGNAAVTSNGSKDNNNNNNNTSSFAHTNGNGSSRNGNRDKGKGKGKQKRHH